MKSQWKLAIVPFTANIVLLTGLKPSARNCIRIRMPSPDDITAK